ncbi:MAG: pilin [Candidatus Peregrinibacteria bacterium]|nr:pilin [Candidatus Peregrinibacteria bacterium]
MRSKLKKIALTILLGLTLVSVSIPTMATLVFAEDIPSAVPTIPQPDLLPGPDEDADQATVQSYFRNQAIPTFINGFLGLIAGVALLALMGSGIRFITSYGNEEGISAAKRMAVWSVVGFGITLLAFAVVSVINTLAFPQGEYDNNANTDQQTIDYDDI